MGHEIRAHHPSDLEILREEVAERQLKGQRLWLLTNEQEEGGHVANLSRCHLFLVLSLYCSFLMSWLAFLLSFFTHTFELSLFRASFITCFSDQDLCYLCEC